MTATPWWNGFKAAYLAKRHSSCGPSLTALRMVYCISEGWGEPVKVGITSNMKARIESLRTATHRDVLICWTATGSGLHENAIKRLLRDQQIRCEWFQDADDRVKAGPEGKTAKDLSAFVEALALHAGHPVYIPVPEPRKPADPVRWLDRPAVRALALGKEILNAGGEA